MKRLFLLLFLFTAALPLSGLCAAQPDSAASQTQPADQKTAVENFEKTIQEKIKLNAQKKSEELHKFSAKKVWIISIGKNAINNKIFEDTYLEVSNDGKVIYRTTYKNAKTGAVSEINTYRGEISQKITQRFIKDLEQNNKIQAKNRDKGVILDDSRNRDKKVNNSMDAMTVSLYVDGALQNITGNRADFGDIFTVIEKGNRNAYTNIIYTISEEEYREKNYELSFLSADKLNETEIQKISGNLPKIKGSDSLETLETYYLQRVPVLLKAIKDPTRLIPVENSKGLEAIDNFIDRYKLLYDDDGFYIVSTRGVFKFRVYNSFFRTNKTVTAAIIKEKKEEKTADAEKTEALKKKNEDCLAEASKKYPDIEKEIKAGRAKVLFSLKKNKCVIMRKKATSSKKA